MVYSAERSGPCWASLEETRRFREDLEIYIFRLFAFEQVRLCFYGLFLLGVLVDYLTGKWHSTALH